MIESSGTIFVFFRRTNDDAAAAKALADIVVAVADQFERNAARQERPEGLPGRSGELDGDRILFQALMPVTLGDFTRQHCAGGAIDVLDIHLDLDRNLAFERGLGLLDQLAVENIDDRMVLPFGPACLFLGRFRLVEDAGEIETLGLPMIDHLTLLEKLGLADDLFELGVAHLGKELPHLFRHIEEEVDDMFRRALEALAQDRILRCDADRTGVEMALAHHDAARGDQRSGREAELVGAKQRTDDDVAASPQAAIDLKRDARTKTIEHQRLLRFRQPHFPWAAGMLERRQRRRACSAVISGDSDVIGARLGNTGRDSSDADFRDELDRDIRLRIDVFQIVDELRQILDGIDVMVWRRRNQTDAGVECRVLATVASTL